MVSLTNSAFCQNLAGDLYTNYEDKKKKKKEKEISFGRFGEGLVLSITVFPFDLLQRRHTPVILEYGLNFPPTSCHKYELVFLSKMFSREIEIDFLVCCDTVSLILTPATPNFNCSQKKKKKNQNK